MMKNFPHQMNDVFRLTRGLQVFANLGQQGENLSDDEVVGVSLARAGVYTFRAKDQTLNEALEMELQKPRSSRGTHTAARDLRRMFLLTGFLQQDESGRLIVSGSGHQLLDLNAADRKADLLLLWGRALRNMPLCDASGDVSHPYRILLRLVDVRPGIAKRHLALALEARDDSDDEFDRLLELIEQQDWETTLQTIEATESSAKNAVKILPAIAEQIGDIVGEGDACYPGSLGVEIGQLTVSEVVGIPPSDRPRLPSRRHRSVTAQGIATLLADEAAELRVPERDLAAIEEGIGQRRERTNRHQRLVQDFARLCENAGFRLLEDPFDCLAVGTRDQSILAEMKTLSGGFADERSQVQRALAQLSYYEFFDLPTELIADHQIVRLAVFESEISAEHQQFLADHQVNVVWHTVQGFSGTAGTLATLHNLGIL
jgi:hypothetical protein